MNEHREKRPVDAHVHFHAPARVAPTLDAAAANFRAVAGTGDGLLGALLLAQASGERVFEYLQESPLAGDWRMTPARDEHETLIARRGADRIAIVCGRQVRTDDGLEVLGLGTIADFPDQLPLADALQAVRSSGALAVLPWGFGKWLGRRGRRVRAALASSRPGELFVGDNGGRLATLPIPATIRAAEQQGYRVLPGSDPFPIASDHRRVGAFGFFAQTTLPESAPWRALRGWLLAIPRSPRPYGSGCGWFRFALNQAGIQLQRRLRSAPA
jgi:hypothetical protein